MRQRLNVTRDFRAMLLNFLQPLVSGFRGAIQGSVRLFQFHRQQSKPLTNVIVQLARYSRALVLLKVSEMLVVEGDQGALGYSSAHARVRQRFTISHEIAHYLLHARKSGKAQLFIEKW